MDFDSFFADEADPLLRYATLLTADRYAAQDAVQSTFERAYRKWDRIGRMDRPDSYVRRMLVNACMDQHRRAARVRPGDPPDRIAPGDLAEDVTLGLAMTNQLKSLPPKERAVVVMRYWGGMDDAEIADQLGCRPTTVRGYHFRAIRKLRTTFDSSTADDGAGT